MKRFRQILFRATLVLIFALVVLCIVGAFLGADRAKLMFNSIPMWFFWGFWAVLSVVGLFARGKMWRSPGLLMTHIGLLLILAGGVWGSRSAHEWRGKMQGGGKGKTPEGFLLLNPHDESDRQSSQLWRVPEDQAPKPAGTLPFDVMVRRAWLEYYPPESEAWVLLGQTYHRQGAPKQLTPLHGRVGFPGLFPALDGEVTVLGYNHALRQIELQVTRRGRPMTNSIIVGPSDEPTVLSLADVFETPQAWREADQPAIVLLPPSQAIRDYKADLVLRDDDGNAITSGEIEVNHPLHARGYHFYLSAFDPPLALVVKAVSDDGLYWVYAGFALLMPGVILRLWAEPIARQMFRKEADHAG
ncbi:MAG: cytochrome c biogenesis protein ResB [Phycisphaerae bacterium]|nr:cytochrome c biogenesis protein ResB [Phycisphaerae bacterium]